MRRSDSAAVLACFVTLLATSAAHAQGTARSLDLDPSIRATGMGTASAAVLWGPGTNFWANPAVTAAESGIRYEWGRTQLIPQLASDITFTTNVLKLGGHGVAAVIAHHPIGGLDLSYGESQGTDEAGNPTGTFEAYERIDTWGFGVSVLQTIESLAGQQESRPVSRWLDVSGGMNIKEVEISLGNPQLVAPVTINNRDWGLAARITPVIHESDDVSVQVDAAFGMSVLSAEDSYVQFPFQDIVVPVSRHEKQACAARIQIGPTSRALRREPWRAAFAPWVQFSAAADWTTVSAGGLPPQYDTRGMGAEIGFANVLWLRAGNYRDEIGQIEGTTYGWGISIPASVYGGVRYDGATFPQSSGLDDQVRHGFQVWLDPWAIARGLSPRSM